jgi:hypothetical protein
MCPQKKEHQMLWIAVDALYGMRQHLVTPITTTPNM